MALYTYIKEQNSVKKRVSNYASYSALSLGAFLLFWAFYPVVSFEVYSYMYIHKKVMSPIPDIQIPQTFASAVLGDSTTFSNNVRDFTQASLWFPAQPKSTTKAEKTDVKEYALSIPQLNIEKAKVIVGGDDLMKSLIHFIPSALVGEKGNVVVFGHSTLPQLYNTRDYKTIFTYLPSLEKGDKVIATIGETRYVYEVYEMFVVKPDQISVLEQKYDDSYLTLITCVPPGTYWNRLVVKAKLIEEKPIL